MSFNFLQYAEEKKGIIKVPDENNFDKFLYFLCR